MRISQAESAVMDALWRTSPMTAEEVSAQVGPAQGWGEATVRTLLSRLVKKGALSTEKDSRRFLYRPLIERADYVASESESLVDRLFDGRVGPLFTHFSERRKLTSDDIADLRRLIEDYEDGK